MMKMSFSENYFREFAKISDNLLRLGVIRTDNIVGELGEFFASKYFNLDLIDVNKADIDAKDQEGNLWQIKSTVNSKSYKVEDIFQYRYLVYVDFNKDLTLKRMTKIDCEELFSQKNCESIILNENFLERFSNYCIDADFSNFTIDNEILNNISSFAEIFNQIFPNEDFDSKKLVSLSSTIHVLNQLDLTKNYDGSFIDNNNNTFKIVSRRVYRSSRRKKTSAYQLKIPKKHFDFIIFSIIGKNYSCNGIWKAKLDNIKNHEKFDFSRSRINLKYLTSIDEIVNIVPSSIDWLK